MPTYSVFDEELLGQINAKASELYLRDKHPYELAYLIFETVKAYKQRYTSKYQRQIDWFTDLFQLREDFQMHSKNAQFRTARMSIIRTVMEDTQSDESSKYEMVRVLADAHELIDHLATLYKVANRPGPEHVQAGILQASAVVTAESSDSKSDQSGPALV